MDSTSLLFMVNNIDTGAVDAVLTAAMLDQPVSVLLLGEGLGLIGEGDSLDDKLAMLQQLPVTFYAIDTDMAQRAINVETPPHGVSLSAISNGELPDFLQRAQHILSF